MNFIKGSCTVTMFSIVISTHKRPALLSRAITSILDQFFKDVQIIVVSDVSCVDTYRVASTLLADGDLFLQRQGDQGPAQSRDLGVKSARGEYVIFLDDDDALSPTYLERAAQVATPTTLTYTNFVVFDEERDGNTLRVRAVHNKYLDGIPLKRLWVKNFIPFSAIVFPLAAVRTRQSDAGLAQMEDWDFLLSAATEYQLRHAAIIGPIIYSRNEGNRSQDCPNLLAAIYRQIYERYLPPSAEIQAARQALLQSVSSTIADDVSGP